VWADWGEDCVLYHRRSGQTHFLNRSSATLLQRVLREPVDAEAASRALDEAKASPEVLDHLIGVLLRFEELGLVERVRG